MLEEIKAVLSRSSDTIIQDAVGTISLFSLLIAGLYLPGLV